MKEGESIQGHIKKLTEIFNELAAIEAQLDEEDKVVQLLASLPEAFDTLVTALEANEKVPAMETVIERLLYEERKSKDRQSESTGTIDQAESLATRVKPKWKRSGVRCHNCGKLGHIQRNCYAAERQPTGSEMKKSERFKSSRSGASVGLLASTHTALAAESNKDSTVNWIIDSGATCHICCNKSMFLELKTLEAPEIVTLGDGR